MEAGVSFLTQSEINPQSRATLGVLGLVYPA